jgi:hypothetical protein
MCLGKNPVQSIASGSAKMQVTTAEHRRTERDGTRSVRLLREAPQSPTAWKTGDEPNEKKTGGNSSELKNRTKNQQPARFAKRRTVGMALRAEL